MHWLRDQWQTLSYKLGYGRGLEGRAFTMPWWVDRIVYGLAYADGLKDPLVILHGMVDTNVHFEDSVRLTQRLIELGKRGWWLVPYPVEDHGFVRPDSWTDEYSRIFTLFETTIRRGKSAAQNAAALGGGTR